MLAMHGPGTSAWKEHQMVAPCGTEIRGEKGPSRLRPRVWLGELLVLRFEWWGSGRWQLIYDNQDTVSKDTDMENARRMF